MPSAKSKTRQPEATVHEPSAAYEVGPDAQHLPVHDKAAALDAIFHDANVKYGPRRKQKSSE